jgi:hypothetical protein
MPGELPEGTTITCPLCREETTTVQRNKNEKPYFYCAEYEAAVNMNAPTSHVESFLREFLVEGDGGTTSGGTTSDETDIERRD